jgi:hypothetical protein
MVYGCYSLDAGKALDPGPEICYLRVIETKKPVRGDHEFVEEHQCGSDNLHRRRFELVSIGLTDLEQRPAIGARISLVAGSTQQLQLRIPAALGMPRILERANASGWAISLQSLFAGLSGGNYIPGAA